MAKPCTVCEHPASQSIDAALMARAVTVSHLSEIYGSLSRAALYRHARNHVRSSVLVPAFVGENHQPGDLLAELLEVLITAKRVRGDAMLSGRPEIALKASRETVVVVELLLSKFGVDDASVVEEVSLGEALALAVGRSIGDVPALGPVIADHLRQHGHEEMAADVEQYAATAALTLEEKKS